MHFLHVFMNAEASSTTFRFQKTWWRCELFQALRIQTLHQDGLVEGCMLYVPLRYHTFSCGKCRHIHIYESCSKFFHLENVIFAKKNSFAELSRAPFLSRYMLAKIFKKNVDVWYPQIVPGVWSLVTLHSAAAALKHLRSALLRCWSLLTFIGQFWHNKSTV